MKTARQTSCWISTVRAGAGRWKRGRTTWVEVFDTRWSHCHQWSGAPTWQLSRYVLGLDPRFDRAINSFDLILHPGSLQQANGRIPLPLGRVCVGCMEPGK